MLEMAYSAVTNIITDAVQVLILSCICSFRSSIDKGVIDIKTSVRDLDSGDDH